MNAPNVWISEILLEVKTDQMIAFPFLIVHRKNVLSLEVLVLCVLNCIICMHLARIFVWKVEFSIFHVWIWMVLLLMFSQVLVKLILFCTFITIVIGFRMTSQIATVWVYSITGLILAMEFRASVCRREMVSNQFLPLCLVITARVGTVIEAFEAVHLSQETLNMWISLKNFLLWIWFF